jgi:hypothetical protein
MLKKNNSYVLMLLVLLCHSTFAFGQETVAKMDFGNIEGSVYRNRYLGLRLTIPDKWQVQDEEVKKQIMAIGKQSVAGNDKQLEKALDASLLHTFNLLTASKYPINSGLFPNPNFACVVEKISQSPSLTVTSYTLAMKSLMQKSQLPYRFEKEIYSQSIGGKSFVVLPTQLTLNGVVYYQDYYTTIIRDYALTFIITYTTKEDLKPLEEMLKSVRFER